MLALYFLLLALLFFVVVSFSFAKLQYKTNTIHVRLLFLIQFLIIVILDSLFMLFVILDCYSCYSRVYLLFLI